MLEFCIHFSKQDHEQIPFPFIGYQPSVRFKHINIKKGWGCTKCVTVNRFTKIVFVVYQFDTCNIQVKHTTFPTVLVQYEVAPGMRLDDPDTSVLRLEVDAAVPLFQDGRLRLRCVATQYTLYRRSAELDIHEDTPQLAPVLGPTVPHIQGR